MYKSVIDALKCVISGEIKHSRKVGLCFVMQHALEQNICSRPFGVYMREIKKILAAWPEHSGNPSYPISSDTVDDAQLVYDNTEDLYDLTTEYGRSRIRLAEYLIVELTKLEED